MTALQQSLLPAHVPAELPKPTVETLAFDFPEGDRPRPADEGDNSDLVFRGRRADRAERRRRLRWILRSLLALEADWSRVKALCRRIEKATGRQVVERTAIGWLQGREPEPDGWEDLKTAFGLGLWAWVFYPESSQAAEWWRRVFEMPPSRKGSRP